MISERKWISVKDKLPEHMDKVLVAFEESDNVLMASFSARYDEFAVFFADGRKVPTTLTVTHWMTAPSRPKRKTKFL